MDSFQNKKVSKFLSLILRHKPETIGLTLDENGWAKAQELLDKLSLHGLPLSIEQLKSIVQNNDKNRFVFSSDFEKIRANQGHSVKIDLQLTELSPPDELYHGTAEQNIDSIRVQGILKGDRHHVHLSSDSETARKVGMRYGKPVILVINAKEMCKEGNKFFRSENCVWLTEYVHSKYIKFEG